MKMKSILNYINESTLDTNLKQTIIDCLALGMKWTGGENFNGCPKSPDKLVIKMSIGAYELQSEKLQRLLERSAGYILEDWVIDHLPTAMKDLEGNIWNKAIPSSTTHYDVMYYKDGNESDNIKIEVKSYKDGQTKNLKYSSNKQKDEVNIYILVDYSVEINTISFNSIKLSQKPDSISEIKTKRNIPVKFVKNADDIKKNDTNNAIQLLAEID